MNSVAIIWNTYLAYESEATKSQETMDIAEAETS